MIKKKEEEKGIKEEIYKQKVNYEIDKNLSGSKELTNQKEEKTNQLINFKKKINWKYIVFPLIAIIIIAIIITLIIIFRKKPKEEEIIDTTISINIKDEPKITESPIDLEDLPDLGPIEAKKEYKIKTNVNDLKRIYINQKYYEDIKVEGSLRQILVDRKTNYDIYIISEIESDEKVKNYYNKTYLCAISIASECVSSKDEYCLPKKQMDLNDQDNSELRNLNEINNLENIPFPLCLFNMTDNNVITSITCHKNLSEAKVSLIVLDLYFFRPPGIQRINKEEGNITITQFKEGEKEVIRETNGGPCNVANSLGSFCTTELNTTKDSDGNLLEYKEIAFTNITSDNDNYYLKNKYTYLLDKTKYLTELNPEKYNETLNKLYPILKDYMI